MADAKSMKHIGNSRDPQKENRPPAAGEKATAMTPKAQQALPGAAKRKLSDALNTSKKGPAWFRHYGS